MVCLKGGCGAENTLKCSSFPQPGLHTDVNQTDLTLAYLTLTLTLHLSRAGGPMVTKKPRVTTEKLKTRPCELTNSFVVTFETNKLKLHCFKLYFNQFTAAAIFR